MRLSTWHVAWRNLGRNRRRTLLAVAAIALGQTLVVAVNGLMSGSFDQMLATVTGPLVGHVRIHHPEWEKERAADLTIDHLPEVLAALEALTDTESVSPRVYAAVLAAHGDPSEQPADADVAMIVGVDAPAETAPGGILEGVPADRLPGTRGAVVGQVLANRLGLEPGQTIAVIGQDADEFPNSDLFEVRAIVHSQVELVNRLGVVLDLESAQRFLALEDQVHEIVVHGSDAREAEPLAASIRKLEPLTGARVLPWREAMPEIASIIDMKGWWDLVFVAILFAAAAAGIANTMMMSTFERTHEFGMLLALGTRPTRVVRLIVLEALLLGLMGVAVGSVLGTAVVLVTSQTGIDYGALGGVQGAGDVAFFGVSFSYVVYPKLEPRYILMGVVAVTVTSVVAATWPASLAARLEPAKAMRL
jgi:putative ABC transport system permease protein